MAVKQQLVDDLAEGLKHARPDNPGPEASLEQLHECAAQLKQWEIDVRSVQQSLRTMWGEHFQWAVFWTKVNAPKAGR